jgi:hypothetical protein
MHSVYVCVCVRVKLKIVRTSHPSHLRINTQECE